MVDFHVDRNTGNDGASGSATQPVRTISRATELAAEPSGATGTIYVAPGEYDLSIGEVFPILVPPRFSLEGTSRTDRPVIRFEATTRDERGRLVPFWGSAAIVVGAGIRHFVIEADPRTDAPSCKTMIALQVNEPNAVLENVELRSRTLEIEPGFGAGIYASGNRGSAENIRIRPGGGSFLWHGGACTLERSFFDTATVSMGEGDHRVTANDFENASLHLQPGTNARVYRNTFRDITLGMFAIAVRGERGASAEGPFIDDNTIRDCLFGITCEGLGSATFQMNLIERFGTIGILVQSGATPVFRNNNRIRSPMGIFTLLLETRGAAYPAFEDTEFNSFLPDTLDGAAAAMTAIRLATLVDFGGGGRSRGNNSFGNVAYMSRADIPRGGTIKAHNNLWPYVGGRLFTTGPGTTVEYDGARLDPDGWSVRP